MGAAVKPDPSSCSVTLRRSRHPPLPQPPAALARPACGAALLALQRRHRFLRPCWYGRGRRVTTAAPAAPETSAARLPAALRWCSARRPASGRQACPPSVPPPHLLPRWPCRRVSHWAAPHCTLPTLLPEATALCRQLPSTCPCMCCMTSSCTTRTTSCRTWRTIRTAAIRCSIRCTGRVWTSCSARRRGLADRDRELQGCGAPG